MNDLLICAERLGIEVYLDSDNSDFVYLANDKFQRYDPRTNDSQAMELLKWLYHQNKQMSFPVDTCGVIMVIDGKVIHEPTLNEAIIRAVVAMEDTHE